jgi:hypothetical protein
VALPEPPRAGGGGGGGGGGGAGGGAGEREGERGRDEARVGFPPLVCRRSVQAPHAVDRQLSQHGRHRRRRAPRGRHRAPPRRLIRAGMTPI